MTNDKSKQRIFLKEKSLIHGLPLKTLEKILFKKTPKYFESLEYSPELVKIFKLLVHRPKIVQDSIEYELDILDKINFIFGIGYRHILTYKAKNTFTMTHGELIDTDDSNPIPPETSSADIRIIYEGDLVLIRVDNKDENEGMIINMQVLTCGPFQETDDDFRQFNIDREDFFTHYRKFLDLKDLGDETIKTENEAFKI